MALIAVVGAGPAGAMAAHLLRERGHAVVVVEARGRIGGRVWSRPRPSTVERGAQVIHGGGEELWALLRRARLRTRRVDVPMALRVELEGSTFDWEVLEKAGAPAPWQVEDVVVGDGTTAAQRTTTLAGALDDAGVQGLVRTIASAWLVQTWNAPLDDADVATVAEERVGRRPGDQHEVVGGFDALPAYLLGGVDVRLDHAVTSVRNDNDDVEVGGPWGHLRADAALITVPPPVIAADTVRFTPPLPDAKRRAAAELRAGDALVVVLDLRHPLPRRSFGVVTGQGQSFWTARDAVIVGVAKQHGAEELRRRLARGEHPAALLQGLLGPLAPDDLLAAEVIDWGRDPWSLGAFTSPRPGARDAARTWAAPWGRLAFAGESTAPQGLGMVGGALASGIRAAAELERVVAAGPVD